MVGVASQIVFCIFAAAVIGSVAGYLIRSIRYVARAAEIESMWKSRLAQRDQELETLRSAVKQSGAAASADEPAHSQPKPTAQETPSESSAGQFERKLSQLLVLIEKLARSQERMEGELAALRSAAQRETKVESSRPKS